MEQSQQRHWLWLYSFIIPWPLLCGVSYALCLLSSLLQCCLEVFSAALPCLGVFSLEKLCLSPDLGFCSLFYLGYFHIALWNSLSGLCALWDSLSSFPSLWLARCTLGWPVWPVIGYPLLGVHPSISIVRLIMIGYHCNHLDGQLNYWASAHWLISVTMMYQLCNWWLGHSTGGSSLPGKAHQHVKVRNLSL